MLLQGVALLLHTQHKQCWFGRLATSTIASRCMTHLLLLLLLWGRDKKPGGSRDEYMQGQVGRAGHSAKG
jgi:hypothetical protein